MTITNVWLFMTVTYKIMLTSTLSPKNKNKNKKEKKSKVYYLQFWYTNTLYFLAWN